MVQPSSAPCGEGTAVGPGGERRGPRSLLQQLWGVGVRLCCGLRCPSVCPHSLHRAGQRTARRGVTPRGGCCPLSVRLPSPVRPIWLRGTSTHRTLCPRPAKASVPLVLAPDELGVGRKANSLKRNVFPLGQ